MRSVLNGLWAWALLLWAATLIGGLGVNFLVSDEVPVAGAIVWFAFAAISFGALVVRVRAPRVAAWMAVVGVGVPGVGFWWAFFIPPIVAAAILVTGVTQHEISFRRNASMLALG